MKKNIPMILLAAAIVVGISIAAVLLTSPSTPAQTVEAVAGQASAEASFAAPAFSVETHDGRTVDSSVVQAEGKPMVVYFMASTCTTCAKNWAALNEVYPEYEDQIEFVAVSVDPTDSAQVISDLADERGFAFSATEGNPELALAYDVKKQTAKFAVDRDGNIVARHDGALTEQEWRDFFEQVI